MSLGIRTPVRFGLAALLISFSSLIARADIITITFSGTVDFVDPFIGSQFSVGQSLTGSFSFDSTALPRPGSDNQFAVYDSLTNLNFTIDSYAASSSGAPEIQVDNDPPAPFSDRYAVVSRDTDGLVGPNVNGFQLTSFAFRLDDLQNSAFSSALTLPTSLDNNLFENRQFFLFFVDGSIDQGASVSGTLDVANVTAVPVPPGIVLGLVGIGCLAIRRRCHAPAGDVVPA